jgi:hypothetical protein
VTADAQQGAVAMGDTQPTDTVGHGQQTSSHPPGSAMPEGGIPVTERPEALVGAAFAGGFLAAMILKRLAS